MPKRKNHTMKTKLESVPVEAINPAQYNPRTDLQPGDDEYQKLKRSMMEFGIVEPIVWNKRTGHIIGGHQRFKILVNDLGRERVDAVVVDMPLAKEKALNIALNKIGGDWDDVKLAELVADLQGDDSIDELLTGFDHDEITQLFEDAVAGMRTDDDGDGRSGEADSSDSQFCGVLIECESREDRQKLCRKLKKDGFKYKLINKLRE